MAEIKFGQNKSSPCDKFWCSKTNCAQIWTSEVHQRASNGFNLTALTWRLCIGTNDSKISLIFGGKKNLDGIVLMRWTHGWSCSLSEVWGFPGRCRSNFSGRLGPLSSVSDLAPPETGLQLPASAPVAVSHLTLKKQDSCYQSRFASVCQCRLAEDEFSPPTSHLLFFVLPLTPATVCFFTHSCLIYYHPCLFPLRSHFCFYKKKKIFTWSCFLLFCSLHPPLPNTLTAASLPPSGLKPQTRGRSCWVVLDKYFF